MFDSLAGHLLIADKALYGLCLYGKEFNHLLTNILCSLCFEPSKAEPSICICKFPNPTKDVYEYVSSYVNDLCAVSYDPKQLLKDL